MTTGIINNRTDFVACFLMGYLLYLPSKDILETTSQQKYKEM